MLFPVEFRDFEKELFETYFKIDMSDDCNIEIFSKTIEIYKKLSLLNKEMNKIIYNKFKEFYEFFKENKKQHPEALTRYSANTGNILLFRYVQQKTKPTFTIYSESILKCLSVDPVDYKNQELFDKKKNIIKYLSNKYYEYQNTSFWDQYNYIILDGLVNKTMSILIFNIINKREIFDGLNMEYYRRIIYKNNNVDIIPYLPRYFLPYTSNEFKYLCKYITIEFIDTIYSENISYPHIEHLYNNISSSKFDVIDYIYSKILNPTYRQKIKYQISYMKYIFLN